MSFRILFSVAAVLMFAALPALAEFPKVYDWSAQDDKVHSSGRINVAKLGDKMREQICKDQGSDCSLEKLTIIDSNGFEGVFHSDDGKKEFEMTFNVIKDHEVTSQTCQAIITPGENDLRIQECGLDDLKLKLKLKDVSTLEKNKEK